MDFELKKIVTTQDAMADYLEGPERTVLFGVRNNTPFPIDMAYGRIKSSLPVATGWVNDSGLFVFGSPVAGSLPVLFDPLTSHWRIYGQSGESSVRIAGNTLSDSYPVLTGPQYYSEITWNIGVKSGSTGMFLSIEHKVVIATARASSSKSKPKSKRSK